MTNNPTIDGVSRERKLFEKFSLDRAERFHPDLSRRGSHPEAEYQNPGTQGGWEIWQGRALLDARPAIDLDAADWSAIQQAASESKWIPPEYYRNDWVSDVCEFLRNGAPAVERQEPVAIVDESDDGLFIEFICGEDGNPLRRGDLLYKEAPEVAALQSTIAQLQTRIAELESGRGEPVAEVEHGPFDDVGAPQWVRVVTLGDYDLEHIPDGTKLYTAPPAPVAVVLPERKERCPATGMLDYGSAQWNACLDATAARNKPQPAEWHDVAGDDEGLAQ